MPIPTFQVDAFTDRPFRGNPAAVCLLEKPADPAWMQDVAREMNLAETAFLSPREDGFDLRWFTPCVEVDLCGHATLASAHVLWSEGVLPVETPARFHTASGVLTAFRHEDWIELDFPAEPAEAVVLPDELLDALGARALWSGRNRLDDLVEIADPDELAALEPDFGAVRRLTHRGVIVTCRSATPEYDFVSRFFAPAAGIDEDPVTGSAHCCLGPFWAERLGKTTLVGYQASARGGVVRVEARGERVGLFGQAVTVLRGELTVSL